MGTSQSARKSSLDHRLETYFSTLRSLPLKSTLKRKLENWQVYAAVGSSAMAMATGASASVISSGIRMTPEAIASFRTTRPLGTSRIPLLKDIRLAMALQDEKRTGRITSTPTIMNAAQSRAPSIAAGGVVPIYGTRGIIQPGEWVSIYGKNLASGTVSW